MKSPSNRVFIGMIVFVAVMLLLTAGLAALYAAFRTDVWLALFITFLTVTYHFAMRIAVGEITDRLCRGRTFRYDRFPLRTYPWEERLFRALCVQKWKSKVITARPEQFDLRRRGCDAILHSMAQAEIVHAINMALSFLPMLLIIPFGQPLVFLLTGIAACLIDFVFVIIQRYNRPRILQLKKRMEKIMPR